MKYDDAPKKHKTLPKLEEGEHVKINFVPVDRETKPPEHYTIETLNNYLKNPFKDDKSSKKKALAALGVTEDEESEGDDTEDYRAIFEGLELGTEATRTGIIDNARQSGYIQLKKDVYTILPDGEFLIESLAKMEISMDKYKTSTLGRSLKRVFRGEETVDGCVAIAAQEIRDIFAKRETTTVTRVPYQPKGRRGSKTAKPDAYTGPAIRAGACPLCGCDVVRGSYAWGCMGYKSGCAFRLSAVILSHTFTPEEVACYLETGRTPLISDFISKKNKKFSAYLQRDGAEAKFVFAQNDPSDAVWETNGEDVPLPTEAPPLPEEY